MLMTLFAAKDKVRADAPSQPEGHAPSSGGGSQVFLGNGPALRNWKVMADPDDAVREGEAHLADESSFLAAIRGEAKSVAPAWLQIMQAIAVFLTVGWFTYSTIYILALPGSVHAMMSSPLTLGGILASVLAPVALLWLCLATWQRRSDAHIYAAELRKELQSLLFPTEEQSKVVNRDIQLLMQQALEMSSSSRAAIQAIQRARQGLRTEIRDFAGVSQKTEFHIDRLAETLNARAEELLSLTEKIEAQSGLIEAKAKGGIESWVLATEAIAEKSGEVERVLAHGVDELLAASEAASGRVQTIEERLSVAAQALSERVGGISDRFAGTSDQFQKHADTLSAVSASVASEVGRLEETISTRVRSLDDLTRKNVSALEEAQRLTLSQYEQIEAGVQRVADTARQVATVTDGLVSAADEVDLRLTARAETLEETSRRIADTAKGFDHLGEVAAHTLTEALSVALSGADTVVTAVRRGRDMFDRTVQDANQQIAQTCESVDRKLVEMTGRTSSHLEQIAGLAEDIDARRERLDASVSRVAEQSAVVVRELGQSCDHLAEAADLLVSKSSAPLQRVESSVLRLEEGSRVLDETLSARVLGVEQGAARIQDAADHLGTSLKNAAHEMTEITGQVSAHTHQINNELALQKQGVCSLAAEMDEKVGMVLSLMRAQTQELSSTLDMTESQIILLGESFFDKGNRIVAKVGDVSDDLKLLEQSVTGTLTNIEAQSVVTKEAIDGAARAVAETSGTVLPQYERLIEKASELEHRYSDLKNSYADSSAFASERLDTLARQFEDRLKGAEAGAEQASRTLRDMSDGLVEAIADLGRVADQAQSGIADLQAGVKGRADDLQLIADQVRVRAGTLQKDLADYVQELGNVVSGAVTHVTQATEQFGQTTDALDQKASAASDKILSASRQYVEEGYRLSLLAEQAVHKASRIVATVQEESSRLVDTATDSLLELQKSGESFALRTREVDEFMKSSVRNAQSYSEELRAQANVVATNSADAVDRIAEATYRLSQRADEVKAVSQSVTGQIETSRTRLSEESDRLAAVAHKAAETADEAAMAFTRHSNTLFKAVQDVSAQAEKIRDTQWKTQREAFLSSARFVIESLYSLALDVSRHLEDDLDERVLRAYQKGDVAVFARYLVDMVPKIPAERTQSKFIEDGEFRNYVQRFIRQFEEILEQAQANDYGDLLSSIFASSDVGKLYKILCGIAGRSAKTH